MERRVANHYFDDDLKNTKKEQIASNARISNEKRSSSFEWNWSYPNIIYYLLRAWKYGIRKSEE